MSERSPRTQPRARPVSATDSLDELLRQLARDIDRAVRSAMGPHPEVMLLTTATRRRIMAAVDEVLATVYPSRRGGRSALGDLIVGQAASRWERAYRREALRLRGLLGAGFVAAILTDDDPDNDLAALLAFTLLPPDQRRQRASRLSDVTRWRDPAGRVLVDRIWNARRATRRSIDGTLRAAVRDGRQADEVAGLVRTAVGSSSRARRLVGHEQVRAEGMATTAVAQASPSVQAERWVLSPTHPRTDHCDINAGQDRYGLGPGAYPPGSVPRFPDHPWCRCRIEPVRIDDPILVDAFRQRYGSGAA